MQVIFFDKLRYGSFGSAHLLLNRYGAKVDILREMKLKIIATHLHHFQSIRIFAQSTRIMTTKLTLTVEKTVIEKAKSYAKHTDRSLSELIESYLETLVEENPEKEQLSPRLKKIAGVVKLPADFDEEKELRNYYENKHL